MVDDDRRNGMSLKKRKGFGLDGTNHWIKDLGFEKRPRFYETPKKA